MPRKGYKTKQPEQPFYHHCNTYLQNCDFWLKFYCERREHFAAFWRQNDTSSACDACKEEARHMALGYAVDLGLSIK